MISVSSSRGVVLCCKRVHEYTPTAGRARNTGIRASHSHVDVLGVTVGFLLVRGVTRAIW